MQYHAVCCAILVGLVVLEVLVSSQLVVEPNSISRTLDYGAAPVQVDVVVRSNASTELNVSVSLVLGSPAKDRRLSQPELQGTHVAQQTALEDDRRLSPAESPLVSSPSVRNIQPSPSLSGAQGHVRFKSRRLLFGWGSPTESAGHARRLRVASEVAAADNAEVTILQSVGVGILHGGSHGTMRRLKAALPGTISFVERDQVLRRQSTSKNFSDPLLSEQWALRAIRHQEAIEQVASRLAMRSSDIVVAVIDSGVHADHPDLAGQLWRNPGEIPGNGIDDDGNGFVDDINGWDFASDSSDLRDVEWHGTHCAGIIAATADNRVGIVGLAAPARARVMVLKFTSSEGGLLSDAISALEYALQNGAIISSNSYGGPTRSAAFERALDNAAKQGHIVVAAAGNEAHDIEITLQFPCAYRSSSLICVAASTKSETLAPFSNYGRSRVHIAAPGTDIVSTVLDGKYAVSSGTSMAAPHVAAALAVLKASFPHLSLTHLKTLLLESARYAPLMSRKVGYRGILDLEAAVRAAFSVAWVKVLQAPMQLGGAITSSMLSLELGVDVAMSPLPEGTHRSSLKVQLWADRNSKGQIIPVAEADLDLELVIEGTAELHFAQASLDFAHVVANSSAARKELFVSNVGNGSADASLMVTGGMGAFSILAPAQGELLRLAPGGTSPILIACSPEHVGALAADLVLTYTWSNGNAVITASIEALGATPPALQLDRWSGVRLLEPSVHARDMPSEPAEWHRLLLGQDVPLVANVRLPPIGQHQACQQIEDGSNLEAHIALVWRGTCTFWQKARHCEKAGAVGMMVVNSEHGGAVTMGLPRDVAEEEVPAIPAFMITREDGETIREFLVDGVSVEAEMRLQPIIVRPATTTAEAADHHWKEIKLEINNVGGAPFSYTVAYHADIFEQTGTYEVQIGRQSDGTAARGDWYSLGDGTEVQYFAGQDDASIFVEFPGPVPFSGRMVYSGWLSLNGYLVLDPDYVPLGSYIPGWIGPEYEPRAIIAPYWDDLYCSTFCKVRVGTVVPSAASGVQTWALVVQFENVNVISGASGDSQTATFQLAVYNDGTIEMVYHKWPGELGRQRLVVGVEGFNKDGFALHDHRDRSILPWGESESFTVRMLPWLVPSRGTKMVGELQAGGHVSLALQLHLGMGDRQGWVTISTKDAYNSYSVSRSIRIAIQTAVRFTIQKPSDPGICGFPVIITVVAESVDGRIASSEERNVVLVFRTSAGSRGEQVVPIAGGVGNVTLSSEVAGDWELSLEDRFATGLNTSATAKVEWISGPARFANIDVRQFQVEEIPFRIAIKFLDQFGNRAIPTAATLGQTASATLRWRSSVGVSGAAVLSLATGDYAVELEFAIAQDLEFWPEPAGETSKITWGSAVTVHVLVNDHEYVTGNWKPCSNLCGIGLRHRDVMCERRNRNHSHDAGHNVSEYHCRGHERPAEYEECSGSCVRGSCNVTSRSSCICMPGFDGLRCDEFSGCPRGTQAVFDGEVLPARCEGVKCQTIDPRPSLSMQVSNRGHYPSQVTFSCPKGHDLVGVRTAACQRDGFWDFGGQDPSWCRGPDARNASCVLGSRCTVNVSGRALESENHLILVRNAIDCPSSGQDQDNFLAVAAESTSTLQRFSWPAVHIATNANLMPGAYSICWASNIGAAKTGTYAFVGILEIQGPLPGNLVCMLGLPCLWEVQGIGFDRISQSFWISAGACAESNALNATKFDGWHADGPNISALGPSSQGIVVDWGVALGGDVHKKSSLCWQSAATDAIVSLGQFVMHGPARHEGFSCTLGILCALTLEGVSFSFRDITALYTDQSCSSKALYAPQNASALLRGGDAARFEFGVMMSLPKAQSRVTGNGSKFMLCWTAGVEQGALPIAVGALQVLGPAVLSNVVCTLGVNCTIRFEGHGFTGRDLVHVVRVDTQLSRCDVDSSPPLKFEAELHHSFRSGFSIESGAAVFNMGLIGEAQLGDYHICWGSSVSDTANVPAGQFIVHGPSSSHYTCKLGETCSLSIFGLGLAKSNRIQIRLQGACGQRLITQQGMPTDIVGTYDVTELTDNGTIVFDFGVPRSGYISRPHKICWQYSSQSRLVDAGMLTLVATSSYLATAASEGLLVQNWVSGYCDIFAVDLDMSRKPDHDAVHSALATMQGVPPENLKLQPVTMRLLSDISPSGATKKTTVYFLTSTDDDAAARNVMARLRNAASSSFSPFRHDFIAELNRRLPRAEVSSVVFKEPWLDTGVFRADREDAVENPWGLPWWPETRLEMFLAGFFSVGLSIVLLTCMACCISKQLRKHRGSSLIAPASPSPSPSVIPAPAPVPRAPSASSSDHMQYRRPDPRTPDPRMPDPRMPDTRMPDPRIQSRSGASVGLPVTGVSDGLPGTRVTDAEKIQALQILMSMGFRQDRAIIALRRNNYHVESAVTELISTLSPRYR